MTAASARIVAAVSHKSEIITSDLVIKVHVGIRKLNPDFPRPGNLILVQFSNTKVAYSKIITSNLKQ